MSISQRLENLLTSLLSAAIDTVTGVLITVPYEHHEIHEGNTFTTGYRSPDGSDIADNGIITILIRVPAGIEAHMLFSGAAGGDAEPQLYEGVTVTGAGTALTEFNLKRSSTKASGVTTFHTPTISGGTLLLDSFLPGGTGGSTFGGVQTSRSEWNLKASTDYAARIINRAGTAQPLSIQIEWYEKAVT